MDTTETNIKMCEKAEEIQGLRINKPPWDTWLIGDYYVSDVPLGKCISVHNDASSYGLAPSVIWLPRQDQLQEIIKLPLVTLIDDFRQFAWKRLRSEAGELSLTSMEQLWLAFVMKEKYEKIWDGKEWKKEGHETE